MSAKKDMFQSFKSARRAQISRRRQEQQKQRIAMVLIASFMLVVLAVIAYGYVSTFVLPPRKLAVRVDNTRYTMGDMIKILRMMQKGSEFFGQKLDLSTTPFSVPLTLVQREIIARAIPLYRIQITPKEVDDEIRSRLLPAPAEGQEVDQAQLDREFKERYRQYLSAIQFSEDEYRRLVKADLERDRFREILGQDIPRVAEHIRLYAIALEPNDNVEILKTKYKDGTPFEQLVKEFNKDPDLTKQKGEIGWLPRKVLEQPVDDMVFNLEIGKLSEPVSDKDAKIVYMASEKAAARQISPENMEVLKNRALQEWLDNEWDKYDIETHFTSDDYAWVAKQLGISSVLQQTQQTAPQ